MLLSSPQGTKQAHANRHRVSSMGYTDTGINEQLMMTRVVELFCEELAVACEVRGEELPDCANRVVKCNVLAKLLAATVWGVEE